MKYTFEIPLKGTQFVTVESASMKEAWELAEQTVFLGDYEDSSGFTAYLEDVPQSDWEIAD